MIKSKPSLGRSSLNNYHDFKSLNNSPNRTKSTKDLMVSFAPYYKNDSRANSGRNNKLVVTKDGYKRLIDLKNDIVNDSITEKFNDRSTVKSRDNNNVSLESKRFSGDRIDITKNYYYNEKIMNNTFDTNPNFNNVFSTKTSTNCNSRYLGTNILNPESAYKQKKEPFCNNIEEKSRITFNRSNQLNNDDLFINKKQNNFTATSNIFEKKLPTKLLKKNNTKPKQNGYFMNFFKNSYIENKKDE